MSVRAYVGARNRAVATWGDKGWALLSQPVKLAFVSEQIAILCCAQDESIPAAVVVQTLNACRALAIEEFSG